MHATLESAVLFNGYAYVTGGLDQNNQIVDTVVRFNPSTNSSIFRESILNTARYGHSMAADGTRIVTCGGIDATRFVTDTCEEYQGKSGTGG